MLGNVQQTNLDRVFDTLDVTRDGAISKADFQIMAQRMRALRPAMDAKLATEIDETFDAWWEAIRRAADADGNGEITREEFVAAIAQGLENDPEYVDKMVKVSVVTFNAADEEGDGRLTPLQVERIYRAYGVNEQLSSETFSRIDLNGDGFVSVDEFVRAARDVYSSNDPEAPGVVMFGPLN
ncbi:EF-hand domain-containing protein [Streptomyces diastatochromogenes]|uniref:EF-hand domain-containing protein n=1 Tax=Streptomyces diastatochromogenes TaxID=42236 RepID=A0A233S2L6_STRDA|nr:EF-hand domain-containing protein [Streptomyces diastatochromogenes]MCZ0989200.1 EF-hand domain-containing protein [Streptomyces diastatochromogenes]OXY89907.1 hypothetical protein BEK98_36640 [Streptomyces diastatochromogenes]